jgi:hypothetical protein
MRRLSALGAPLVLAVVAFASVAAAQDQVVVSLPFTSAQTAGPRAQDYPSPQDNLDLWVLEDFSINRAWALTQFSCFGNGFGPLTDVVAVILDGLPPGGHEIFRSVPGMGRETPFNGWATYSTNFGGQVLGPGSYWVMWTVQGNSPQLLPIMFAQSGPYAVGQGTPNTSYQYNPGLGWGWPEGSLRVILDGLNHTGNPTGLNFTIRGNPATLCGSADFNHDGDAGTDADIEAFFACLAGNCCGTCGSADFNGDGDAGTDADIEAFFRVLAGGAC